MSKRRCPFLIKEELSNNTVAQYDLTQDFDKIGISQVDDTYCQSFCRGQGCKYFIEKKCVISENDNLIKQNI